MYNSNKINESGLEVAKCVLYVGVSRFPLGAIPFSIKYLNRKEENETDLRS